MLHLNGDLDTEKNVLSSFLDLRSLDARYLQEMYIDGKSTFIRSRNFSPLLPDSSISHTFSSPFLSSTPISTVNISTMNMPQLAFPSSNYINFNPNSKDMLISNGITKNGHARQQQQQNIDIENITQQQYSHNIEAHKKQKNEISKSLKMFAMLAAYKNGNDSIRQRDSPVDDIMQDFYCNGYVTDDSNSFQQGKSFMETPLHNQYCLDNRCNMNFNINYVTNSRNDTNLVVKDNDNIVDLNQHYLNQNVWTFQMPAHSPYFGSGVTSSSHPQHATTVAAPAAATAAAAANLDYNSQNIKKPQKRYGSTKFEKYSAVKHCVFCENNNEPEAVVKSHAVRDSLGRVLCPKLRTYICPICKASGDEAHTVKYCPQKPIITMEDALKAESLRLVKNSYFNQRMKV